MIASRLTPLKRLLSKNGILFKYYQGSLHKSTISFDGRKEPRLKVSEKYLVIDGRDTFPHVWLRDNCQCEKCFHRESKSRIIDWKNFDLNAKPTDVTLKEQNINVRWSDGHSSSYHLDWLQERSFTDEARNKYNTRKYQSSKVEWSEKEFELILKKFDFNSLLYDDAKLKQWLEQLCVYGIALVKEVSPVSDSCRRLANRVDYIRRTHYGEEFIVQSKPDTTNVAYMSSNLQLHTDLPYYEYKPGVNLLHCVTQTNSAGGENLLCDGLYVCKSLKEHHKAEYSVLSNTQVEWEDIGEEKGNKFHTMHRAPVIQENGDGVISRISYSTPQRGSHMDAAADQVERWYGALKVFVDSMHRHCVKYKMSEGEMVCFDNRRILHGRTGYEDTSDNTRYVIGVYLDWDNIYSRLRVLRKMEEIK